MKKLVYRTEKRSGFCYEEMDSDGTPQTYGPEDFRQHSSVENDCVVIDRPELLVDMLAEAGERDRGLVWGPVSAISIREAFNLTTAACEEERRRKRGILLGDMVTCDARVDGLVARVDSTQATLCCEGNRAVVIPLTELRVLNNGIKAGVKVLHAYSQAEGQVTLLYPDLVMVNWGPHARPSVSAVRYEELTLLDPPVPVDFTRDLGS